MKRKRNRGGAKGSKAAPASSVSLATQWDQGAMGAANRLHLVTEDAVDPDAATGEVPNPNGIKRARRKSLIEVYAASGLISEQQLSVALRLREMADGSGAQDPLAAMRIDVSGGHYDREAARIDRRRPFYLAWAAVPDECSGVMEKVVLEDIAVEMFAGPRMDARLEAFAKIRVGLDSAREAIG